MLVYIHKHRLYFSKIKLVNYVFVNVKYHTTCISLSGWVSVDTM